MAYIRRDQLFPTGPPLHPAQRVASPVPAVTFVLLPPAFPWDEILIGGLVFMEPTRFSSSRRQRSGVVRLAAGRPTQ